MPTKELNKKLTDLKQERPLARIRTIKPDFFLDEKIADLGPYHRLLFQGLWLLADREGKLEDRPRYIKVQIFPYDEGLDTSEMISEILEAGLIIRYQVGDKDYIKIKNFLKHQKPNNKEPESVIPEPKLEGLKSAQVCLSKLEATRAEGKGRGKERKGKEMIIAPKGASKKTKRGSSVPKAKDFIISDDMKTWAEGFGIRDPVVLQRETDQFLDYHAGKGSVMKDWVAAWRTWMRNHVKFRNEKNGTKKTESSRVAGNLKMLRELQCESRSESVLPGSRAGPDLLAEPVSAKRGRSLQEIPDESLVRNFKGFG